MLSKTPFLTRCRHATAVGDMLECYSIRKCVSWIGDCRVWEDFFTTRKTFSNLDKNSYARQCDRSVESEASREIAIGALCFISLELLDFSTRSVKLLVSFSEMLVGCFRNNFN